MTDVEPRPHPAKYSKPILDYLRQHVNELHDASGRMVTTVLDPMAGVGGIHELQEPLKIITWGVELEPEWAAQHHDTYEGDATNLEQWMDKSIDIVCFSPPYGNRMADQFNSKDPNRREVTYKHFLGRRLDERSVAGLQWGQHYMTTMSKVLIECKRVCRGEIIINVSDFIRNRQVVPVVDWYVERMLSLGYAVVADWAIGTSRMRFGANSKLRVECERVITFRLQRFRD